MFFVDVLFEIVIVEVLQEQDIDSVWFIIFGVLFVVLDYVILDNVFDDQYVVWYLEMYSLWDGFIMCLGMVVGCYKGYSFIYGYGFWSGVLEEDVFGYIFVLLICLLEFVFVKGIGLKGVMFDWQYDLEINFELFIVFGFFGQDDGYVVLRFVLN